MQTVRNLKQGVSYMVRWGYSLAAKSYDGPNVRVQTIGRRLGVDPTGGRDPHAPTVLWGPEVWDGRGALNLPQMQMIFVAASSNATIFCRAMATDGSGGENRCWIDAICMEARTEIPAVPITPAAPSPPPAPPPAPSAGSATTYTVQSGDTLFAIARKLGVMVDAIVAANNIANPSLIKPGQVLTIPAKS
ncbi:MAG: LysM peptidoglycan-binding domain-containing protein [Chloroflexota bacterium]|nr:LysM peptidoglycan-binding domain-containing protein [Chloroflexota bacterium]